MKGVLGLLDVILSSDVSQQQRSHLERIQYSGDLLQRILNDILEFSKLNIDKLVIEISLLVFNDESLILQQYFNLRCKTKVSV
jgi:signal transduction histidine kinase